MPKPALTSRERKNRIGGCFTIAAQRARIASKSKGGAGGVTPGGVVAEIMTQHGLLTVLMTVIQMLGQLTAAAVGTLAGFIGNFGRQAPAVLPPPRRGDTPEPVAKKAVQAAPTRSRVQPAQRSSASVGAAAIVTELPTPKPVPAAGVSSGFEARLKAGTEAKEESKKIYGRPEVYEYIAQSLERDLDPPLDRYVRGLGIALEKVSPEVARLISRDTNNPNSQRFKTAKDLLGSWMKANPGLPSSCGARAIIGDLCELQRAWEDAHRPDPTKGPTVSGPANDAEDESGGKGPKRSDDPPVPTPFRM